MTRRGDAELTVDDIEWEDPPRAASGRGPSPEVQKLIADVLGMVPALRQRVAKWAVVESYTNPKDATARASSLRKAFKGKDTVEGRLRFRAAKLLDGGAKVYVQLRPAEGDE